MSVGADIAPVTKRNRSARYGCQRARGLRPSCHPRCARLACVDCGELRGELRVRVACVGRGELRGGWRAAGVRGTRRAARAWAAASYARMACVGCGGLRAASCVGRSELRGGRAPLTRTASRLTPATRRTPIPAQDAANHAGRRAERGWHEGRSPRALGHPYRVDRLRFVTGALIRADSHHIAHSTRHRKSRSPRQRARGLRPSCHPALRAGVLGGAESAAREGARIARRRWTRRA